MSPYCGYILLNHIDCRKGKHAFLTHTPDEYGYNSGDDSDESDDDDNYHDNSDLKDEDDSYHSDDEEDYGSRNNYSNEPCYGNGSGNHGYRSRRGS